MNIPTGDDVLDAVKDKIILKKEREKQEAKEKETAAGVMNEPLDPFKVPPSGSATAPSDGIGDPRDKISEALVQKGSLSDVFELMRQ